MFNKAFALALTLAASAPAIAKPAETVMTAAVPIAGLDLTNPADQAKLQLRIRRAARTMCRGEEFGLLALEAAADRCAKAAIASAQPQVNRQVTLAFERKRGEQLASSQR